MLVLLQLLHLPSWNYIPSETFWEDTNSSLGHRLDAPVDARQIGGGPEDPILNYPSR